MVNTAYQQATELLDQLDQGDSTAAFVLADFIHEHRELLEQLPTPQTRLDDLRQLFLARLNLLSGGADLEGVWRIILDYVFNRLAENDVWFSSQLIKDFLRSVEIRGTAVPVYAIRVYDAFHIICNLYFFEEVERNAYYDYNSSIVRYNSTAYVVDQCQLTIDELEDYPLRILTNKSRRHLSDMLRFLR